MAIGVIQWNVEGVKSLTLSQFKKLYQKKLGNETENTYYKVTGFKPKSKKKD